MIDKRQHFRLRVDFDVNWSIPDQNIEGGAIVYNISLLGVLFVTDKLFQSDHGLTMCFSTAQTASFPSKGKLMWFRKVGKEKSQFQCGVRFFHEAAQSRAWTQWMEDNILKLAEAESCPILERILSEEP